MLNDKMLTSSEEIVVFLESKYELDGIIHEGELEKRILMLFSQSSNKCETTTSFTEGKE